MKCPKCNYQVENSKFCPVCGARFSNGLSDEEKEARRKEREREQAQERMREKEKSARYDEEQKRAEAKERENEGETIYVDPRKAHMHSGYQGQDFGSGFADLGDILGSFFGGNIFGSSFGGRRRRSFGLFDIFEDFFGGDDFYGGSSRQSRRAHVVERDKFYYIDKRDEEGFPVFFKDKLIDVSPAEFERIKRESKGGKKKR